MKVLVAPMASAAETSGPFMRAKLLCEGLLKRNHEVALCAAEDVNYKKIENVKNYFCTIPSPLGLPPFIGKNVFKVVQKLGIQQRKPVHSFEEVLHFVGATPYKHFCEDVSYIRKAIQDFKPDIVFAEFRIAAIVAAKLENVKCVTGYSYPVQKKYACDPKFSKGVKRFLSENNLAQIESVLDIFNWADIKIVPSSYELEPIEDSNAKFVGPFSKPSNVATSETKNKIITYVGNGTLTANELIKVLTNAFNNNPKYEIYISTKQVKPFKSGNITVAEKFDFSKLLPNAILYINHGGQNSIISGLIYGVPQIICPGNVFERKYNANSVEKLKAGIYLEKRNFTTEKIISIVTEFEKNQEYSKNSKNAGEELLKLGGVDKVVDILEGML